MTAFIITIDGPSGSGKGTIANRLAQHYGFHLLDSGALYRLIGLAAQQAGLLNQATLDIAALDITALTQLTQSVNMAFKPSASGEVVIFLNHQDVTQVIRTEQVGALASTVATVAEVRQALLQRQQDFAQLPGLVADGRDMGTVVFPTAPIKIYLTASAEARAARRVKQLQGMGISAKIGAILSDLQARYKRDTERAVAPLKPASDALVIDSSSIGIETVLQILVEHINSRYAGFRQA